MLVSELKARTGCEGQAIYLTWTLPQGATRVRVYRKANDWNFYLDEPADLIYDGVAISQLDDVPAAAWRKLAGDTYYYYTVVATSVGSPAITDFEVAAESRVFGLSLEVLDGKDWIWRQVPLAMKRLDATPKEQGGGEGDLEKWITVMGCWLNLERGRRRALLLHADDSKTPYPLAQLRNLDWGVEPDGEAYDFQVARRFNQRAAYLFQVKGTCPGLQEVVKIYTGWDSECIDFASTVLSDCQEPLMVATYDGFGAYAEYVGEDFLCPQSL